MNEIKLNGESKDIIQENVSKLKEIFPEIVTEDKIDFDKLKLILGNNIDESPEKYNFTWPGKIQSIKESQKTSYGTLRPCKEESKNWDSTENLYIEGDNLEVLKLLQKSYNNKISAIYIDPPYNSRQYSDAYHLLENVATWEKQEVFGVAKKMKRNGIKSKYCSVSAPLAFKDLIENVNAKYIIVSYNNMGTKGAGRSQAKISDEDIMNALSSKGKVKVYETDFNQFNTGKTHIDNHKERLFICKVGKISKTKEKITEKNIVDKVKSPLNYTGGKYKLLNQIIPIFPKDLDLFVDLFSGGANVGVNVNAKRIVCVDKQKEIIRVMDLFKKYEDGYIIDKLEKIIGKYIDNITIEKKNNKFEISNIEFRKNYLEDMIYNHYKFNTPCNVYMYEDEYGIPLKLNHELKTMKEAENYFKRLEKYVGDYKLNYYISEIDEKENRFNYTQNNDVEKIIRLIGIGDKRKKDDFKLGVITLDLSMFKDKDGKEIYKKLFDKLEKERLTFAD